MATNDTPTHKNPLTPETIDWVNIATGSKYMALPSELHEAIGEELDAQGREVKVLAAAAESAAWMAAEGAEEEEAAWVKALEAAVAARRALSQTSSSQRAIHGPAARRDALTAKIGGAESRLDLDQLLTDVLADVSFDRDVPASPLGSQLRAVPLAALGDRLIQVGLHSGFGTGQEKTALFRRLLEAIVGNAGMGQTGLMMEHRGRPLAASVRGMGVLPAGRAARIQGFGDVLAAITAIPANESTGQRAEPLYELAGGLHHLPDEAARPQYFERIFALISEMPKNRRAMPLTGLIFGINWLPQGAVRLASFDKVFAAIKEIPEKQRAGFLVMLASGIDFLSPDETRVPRFHNILDEINEIPPEQRAFLLGELAGRLGVLPEHARIGASAAIGRSLIPLIERMSRLPPEARLEGHEEIIYVIENILTEHRAAPLAGLADQLDGLPPETRIDASAAISRNLSPLIERMPTLPIEERMDAYDEIFNMIEKLAAEHRRDPLNALAKQIDTLPKQMQADARQDITRLLNAIPEGSAS